MIPPSPTPGPIPTPASPRWTILPTTDRVPNGGSRWTMISSPRHPDGDELMTGDTGPRLRSSRIAGGAVALVVAAALLFAPAARAQFSLGSQRAGTSSGSFLKIGVGARAAALGEAFVAVANDPSAIYWNPAGLASMQRQEFQLSHLEWPADIRYEFLAYVVPSQRFGGSV